MEQKFIKNTKYEILTPNGWEDFEGIIKNFNVNKEAVVLTTASNHVIATNDHRFYSNGIEKKAIDFEINDLIDKKFGSEIIHDKKSAILTETYDIFNSVSHKIYANMYISHQCDELAFVPPRMATEFWAAIQPTLSTGGSCIVTSTPNGDTDQFSQIWNEANRRFDVYGNVTQTGCGENGFYPLLMLWNLHPDRGEDFKKEYISKLGEDNFAREYDCIFLSAESTLVNAQTLKRISKGEREKLFDQGTVRWYQRPKANHSYVVALDPSLGTNNDYAALQVIELPTLKQVAEWRDNKSSTHTQVQTLLNILRYLYYELGNHPAQQEVPELYWSVENNTIGEGALVCIADTGEENFPGEFVHDPINKKMGGKKRKGLYTANRSKLNACSRLKSLIETERLTVYSKPLIHELKNFVASGASFKAKVGETDDLVMSLLIALRVIEIVSKYNEDVYDRINESIEIDDSWLEPLPILF